MLCGWGVKAGVACLQVTLCVAIPADERFGKCYSIQRRFTNVQVYFTLFYFILSDHQSVNAISLTRNSTSVGNEDIY